MTPVLITRIDECPVCGEVASASDLLYIETQNEADAHDLQIGDVICRECAGEAE